MDHISDPNNKLMHRTDDLKPYKYGTASRNQQRQGEMDNWEEVRGEFGPNAPRPKKFTEQHTFKDVPGNMDTLLEIASLRSLTRATKAEVIRNALAMYRDYLIWMSWEENLRHNFPPEITDDLEDAVSQQIIAGAGLRYQNWKNGTAPTNNRTSWRLKREPGIQKKDYGMSPDSDVPFNETRDVPWHEAVEPENQDAIGDAIEAENDPFG